MPCHVDAQVLDGASMRQLSTSSIDKQAFAMQQLPQSTTARTWDWCQLRSARLTGHRQTQSILHPCFLLLAILINLDDMLIYDATQTRYCPCLSKLSILWCRRWMVPQLRESKPSRHDNKSENQDSSCPTKQRSMQLDPSRFDSSRNLIEYENINHRFEICKNPGEMIRMIENLHEPFEYD